MGRWAGGLNFQCRGRGTPWGGGVGSCAYVWPEGGERSHVGGWRPVGWPVCIHYQCFPGSGANGRTVG